jgi:exodeoxyribonuclease-3
MRIRSWNINGLRAIMGKGFPKWLSTSAPDIVGVQEVRAHREQLDAEVKKLEKRGFHVHIAAAEKKGYSGVGLFSRRAPDAVSTTIAREYDVEGRVQMARFGKLLVVNVYVPNGNGKMRDNSRVPYKLAFSRAVFDALEHERKRGGRILVMGDINTAHQEIDLARPKQNLKTSGFLTEERAELDRWLKNGWVDTFRHFEKGPHHYSWWSSRFGVREKLPGARRRRADAGSAHGERRVATCRERNIGWRIDLVLASEGAMPFVTGACIEHRVKGSDHAPVGVDIDEAVID